MCSHLFANIHICPSLFFSGYRNANNSRVRNAEAQIRKGLFAPPLQRKRAIFVNPTSLARAFMGQYVVDHSQKSPALKMFYVDHLGNTKMFNKYLEEATKKQYPHIDQPSFEVEWRALLSKGSVTDPETSEQFGVQIRKKTAKGFAQCNKCAYYMMKARGTRDAAKRQAYIRKYEAHIQDVYHDREELARIQRLCIVSENHCGFFIDAADSNKFSIPTTTSTAKQLSQLWRVKQKLTCVQMFNSSKHLYFFRTLPDIPTGGNLTCTIIAAMLARKEAVFRRCSDLYINVDGSGDNINYTFVYALVHILLSARDKKWKLARIHLLRMKVGHTHNDLDAAFGVLSRVIYGKHARGDSRMDLLSFTKFKEVQSTHACMIYPTYNRNTLIHYLMPLVGMPRGLSRPACRFHGRPWGLRFRQFR